MTYFSVDVNGVSRGFPTIGKFRQSSRNSGFVIDLMKLQKCRFCRYDENIDIRKIHR